MPAVDFRKITTCISSIAAASFLLVAACSPPPAENPAAAERAAGGQPPNAGVKPASADGSADFETADGNIGCNYIPAGGNGVYHSPDGGAELICDRIEPRYVRFSLSVRGAATLEEHVRDTGCCGGPIMAAGAHWAGGPFGCDVGEGSVQCENADHKGFTLSRSGAVAS